MALTKIPGGVISDDAITSDKIAAGVIQSELNSANYQPSHRNLLINGNFDVWQRGTSFTYTAEVYTADRWVSWSSVDSSTIERGSFDQGQTEVPGNPDYYLRFTGSGSETGVRIDQRIEFPKKFINETLTLTFYARSSNSMTPTYIYLGIKDVSTGTNFDNFTNENPQAMSSSWQKFTYTFTPTSFPSVIQDGVDYVQFGFRIPNNYAGTFDISQIQLEFGSHATPFERVPYDIELHRCKRYYHTTLVDAFKVGIDGQGGGNWFIQGNTMFPNTMRVAPTIRGYAHGHQANAMAPFGDGRADNMTFYQNGGTTGYPNHGGNLDFARDRNRISAVSAGFNTTAGVKYFCGFTADAEL